MTWRTRLLNHKRRASLLGLHGCGFFHVRDDRIVFQRGYFDQLSFFRLQGIPVPASYLGT